MFHTKGFDATNVTVVSDHIHYWDTVRYHPGIYQCRPPCGCYGRMTQPDGPKKPWPELMMCSYPDCTEQAKWHNKKLFRCAEHMPQ